ncbi:hypothetical protein GCM10028822_08340 [Hymenobacter terrigena]
MNAQLNNRLKVISIVVAVTSIAAAISTMLNIATLIIPTWFLVLLYFPILLLISFLLAKVFKWATKGKLDTVTYTASFISILSLWFFISQYKPSYTITVPTGFNGTVHLFLSKADVNELNVNNFGIGYIKSELYYKGFKPHVLQNGMDITNKITDFATGSMSSADIHGKSLGPYSFLSFKTPGAVEDTLNLGPEELIKVHALDTLKAL